MDRERDRLKRKKIMLNDVDWRAGGVNKFEFCYGCGVVGGGGYTISLISLYKI